MSVQAGHLHPRLVLLALVFIFALPMLAAWLLTRQGADWHPMRTANHGTLVRPARPVAADGLADVTGQSLASDFLIGRWTLVFLGSTPCDDTCRRALYNMRQTRLAMGQHMGRVQRLYVVRDAPTSEERMALMKAHPDLRIARAPAGWDGPFRLQTASAMSAGRTYLIDPLGHLMMYYPPDAEAKGMLKDLQRLLRASKAG